MKAPERCLYCNGERPDCGFCENGKPLDTQADWNRSWGAVFDSLREQQARSYGLRAENC